jgi:hypothetical protein
LAQDKFAFDSLVDVIVASPQFLNKRGSTSQTREK